MSTTENRKEFVLVPAQEFRIEEAERRIGAALSIVLEHKIGISISEENPLVMPQRQGEKRQLNRLAGFGVPGTKFLQAVCA